VLLAHRMTANRLLRWIIILGALAVMPVASAVDRGFINLATFARAWGAHPSYGFSTEFNMHPENPVIVFDLAGITLASGHDVFPRYFSQLPTHSIENLRKCYIPYDAGPLYFDWSVAGFPKGCKDFVGHRSLLGPWISAILHEPRAYIEHRLWVSRNLLKLGLTNIVHCNLDPFMSAEGMPDALRDEPPDQWQVRPHFLLAVYQAIAQGLNYLPIFKLYFWGLLGLFFLYWAWSIPSRTNAIQLAIALIFSGLFLILVLCAVCPSDFYRYFHWTVASVFLAAYILIDGAVRSPSLRPPLRRTLILASLVLAFVCYAEYLAFSSPGVVLCPF
jgi:hypothetical protein